jgi:hypothetical protein
MNVIENEREDIESLLPWYAAGTLSRRDAERVEKALADDHELARRLDLAREELNETILLNETLGAPSARAVEKLFAAIDAEPKRSARVSFDLAGRIAEFFAGFSPRTLAVAGSVAVLAIVLQSGFIVSDLLRQQTGSGGQDTELASAPAADGSLAVIRFTAKTDMETITKFLAANNATFVDGPLPGGTYKIRLPATGAAKDEIIKKMNTDSSIVEFAATVQ